MSWSEEREKEAIEKKTFEFFFRWLMTKKTYIMHIHQVLFLYICFCAVDLYISYEACDSIFHRLFVFFSIRKVSFKLLSSYSNAVMKIYLKIQKAQTIRFVFVRSIKLFESVEVFILRNDFLINFDLNCIAFFD